MADAFGDQLTFPVLSITVLVEGFRHHLGKEFDIRVDDFLHPSKERWVRLYSFLLAHMTDNDVDDLMHHMRAVGHDNLVYPELYAENQVYMNLKKLMAQALVPCRVVNFTIDDIVCPAKKRLVYVLSGVLNYICFLANRKEEHADMEQKMASQVEQKELLRKENEELVKRIEEIRKRRAEESEAAAKVLGQVEVARPRFEQLSKNNAVLKKATEDLQLSIGKKRLDMHKRQERVTRVGADIQKIEEQIVSSPGRFEAEIRDAENRLDEMKTLQKEKVTRLNKRKKMRNPEVKEECHQDLKDILANLQKKQAVEQVTVELASDRGRVHELQEAAAVTQRDSQKVGESIVKKQERLDKMEVVQQLEEEEAELELQKLMVDDEKRKDLVDEWELIDSQRQSIQVEAADEKKEHEANMKLMQEEYASLKTSFEEYNLRILDAKKNAIPDTLKDAAASHGNV